MCHILDENRKEVGRPVKVDAKKQDFTWRKRAYPINREAIPYTDYNNNQHYFVNVNESDGTVYFLTPKQLNLYESEIGANGQYQILNKCGICGDKISIDASNVYDMIKRKTIGAIWGIDQSHIVLLIIMGIVAIAGLGGIFYLLGQNQTLQKQLLDTTTQLAQLKAPEVRFILGVFFNVN